MAIIYKLTNTLTGKSYIGQTQRTLNARWKEHYRTKPNDTHISRAIQKYGIGCWAQDVVENIDPMFLNDRETYWIAYYDSYRSGYNSTRGGTNHPFTEETRQKLREKSTAREYSKETRRRIGDAHRGKIVSKEARCRMSEAQRRRFSAQPVSDDTRQKIREANYDRAYAPLSEEARLNMSGRSPSIETRAIWSSQRKGKQWSEKRRASSSSNKNK